MQLHKNEEIAELCPALSSQSSAHPGIWETETFKDMDSVPKH